MSKNLFFIFNPLAGKGKIRGRLMDIIQVLSNGGYRVCVYPTKGPGDGVQAVQMIQEDQYDLLVCSGGDGTLDEVVTGMMESGKKIPIGYIPAGSTNDFAASLGLPKNMVSAAQIAISGKRFPCDIGTFNSDIFVYIAAFGIFTDVSYETPQSTKNALGHMAYILEGMKRLPAMRTYRMEVCFGGMEIREEFLFGMISNSTSVGGFKKITGKYVELNDGLFEVTLIRKPKNALELNQIMTALVAEDTDAECILYTKTDRISFRSEEEVAWTLDGEFGGSHRLVEIANRTRAIEILVPEEVED